jgi:uncharacterized protein YdbL (DUF1318 family)
MIRTSIHRRAGLALLLAGALAATAAPAFAADAAAAKAAVDAAKARGEVGEQGDGYLGLVTAGASAEVRAAVAEINNGRQAVYRDTASKTGVTPEAAGQATFRQLMDRLPPGQFYKPLNGGWTKK